MNLKTFFQVSYGVYVIGSKKSDKINGMIATTVCQVTAEPIIITVTVNKQNLSHEFIKESNVFSVSILEKETPFEFIGNFGFKSGKSINKFENVNYKLGITQTPLLLDNTIGIIEAKVINYEDVGTHTIFIGEVVDAEVLLDQEPLTYAYYHEVKGGKSPKTAPTHIIYKK